MSTTEITRFGRDIRDKYFMYDPAALFLNHGSYGGVTKPVWEARIREMKAAEFQPGFYRRNIVKKWFENLREVASFLGANEENLVFVETATAGVNAVVKSLPLQKEDSILVYSWSYTACVNACQVAARNSGASVVTWNLKYPIKSKEEVVESFKKCLDENSQVKLAMIDLISSPTAVLFPVEEMIAVCKARGILVLIDGAHGPGQVDLNLEKLGAHFFTGTLHKWVYAARGCAILWVHPNFHSIIKPVLTSANLDHEDFRYDFCYQATRDYTPYFSVKEALQFYQQIGGHAAITSYNNTLLEKATEYLVKVWGTERFPIPCSMETPNMRMIRLPHLPSYPIDCTNTEAAFSDYPNLMLGLFDHYNTQCACRIIQGKPWLRISANVYNTMEEYEKLGQYILELTEESKST